MLERYLDDLLLEMRPAEEFLMAIPARERTAWAVLPADARAKISARADRWADKDVPALSASGFISYSRAGISTDYETRRHIRRVMLRDLTLGSCVCPDGRYDMRLCDIVWAVCEESSWILPADNPITIGRKGLPLPDVYAPRIDIGAAETISDLALCVQTVSQRLDAVSPQLIERIEREIDRRVIRPFLSLNEMAWMCGPKRDALKCLSAVMMGFLTFERNDRQRWQCMRKAWGLFDRLLSALPADGSTPGALEDWADIAEPVMDMAMMTLSATRGRVDIRGEKQIRLLCHYPVFCHIGGDFFVNPGQRSMRAGLDGTLLYRLGDYIGDDALCELGACLRRTNPREESEDKWLLAKSADLFRQEALSTTPARQPYRRQGYFAHMQMMVARGEEDTDEGLAVAVRAGSNASPETHPDTGDVVLFCDGEGVLVDAGFLGDTMFHNLPVVDGVGQDLGTVFGARDVSCEMNESYAMMSMDLAKAYPASCGIRQWQRAVLFQREDGIVQLIELYELDAPKEVTFNFITPVEPELGAQWAQLGHARMRWDGDLIARCDPVPVPDDWRDVWGETIYHLSLTAPQPQRQGKLTFSFNPLKAIG